MILLPLFLQAVFMVADEFYFHRQRGLGLWERVGHPLDTLTFLAPIAIACFLPLNSGAQLAFIALGAFSCLFVTKDEFVHSHECRPFENWLHSVLFVLHPICLFSVYLLWSHGATNLLRQLFFGVLLFGFYQAVYWNLVRRKSHAA